MLDRVVMKPNELAQSTISAVPSQNFRRADRGAIASALAMSSRADRMRASGSLVRPDAARSAAIYSVPAGRTSAAATRILAVFGENRGPAGLDGAAARCHSPPAARARNPAATRGTLRGRARQFPCVSATDGR